MAEPIKTPTPEVYAREAEYMQNMGTHSNAFDAMLNAVPEDRQDIKVALQNVYHVEPDLLTDLEKLDALKESNESLYNDLNAFVSEFVDRKINLARQEKHIEWMNRPTT